MGIKEFMKYIVLILLLGCAGCEIPTHEAGGDNFAIGKPVIKYKNQTDYQKEAGIAQFGVAFNTSVKYFIFPENFGNVNDSILFTNNMMYAAPIKK